jgi:subtilase family serine protease
VDASDFLLPATRAIPALAAGESHAGTTALTLPQVSPGPWYVLAVADAGGAVVETQEINNTKFAGVLIGPDLTALTVTAPSTSTAGATISVLSTIKNGGAGAAGASTTRFYLSTNMVFDQADTLLAATQAVPALAADGSFATSTQVELPADKVGNYFLLVVADGTQAVAETSENNNVAARLIQLAAR